MAITRRTFVGSASAALAWPRPGARIVGANREMNVAVVGVRGQGRTHIAQFEALPDARVVAICDVDSSVLSAQQAAFEKRYGRPVEGVSDLRRLLDRKDIDIISTATPNHWHALVGIWACQAGKDAYVEKPISHNVWEGRQLVRAARRSKRLVQGGTQSRSMQGIRDAVAFLRDGKLGRVRHVHGLCYKPRPPIGKVGFGRAPESVDYSLWCGPAPFEPLRRKDLHYDWHWQWPTGNGDLGNQGIHQVDVARWIIGDEGLPTRMISIGGRVGYADDGETPNTQLVFYDYPSAPLLFEVRGLPSSVEHRQAGDAWRKNMDVVPGFEKSGSIGVTAFCEQGRMVIDTGSARAYDSDGQLVREFKGGGDHYKNFVDAVQVRDQSLLHADVEETHLSSALCHLGGISHQVGSKVPAAELAKVADRHPAFAAAFADLRAHLERNAIDLDKTPLTLGHEVYMDQVSELIFGHHAANTLLARPYREPYVLPAIT